MKLHQLFLFSLATRIASAGLTDDEFELRQLTDDNFKASTTQGLWLVEHYSPRCGHCRAFAPTWERIAEESQYLERLSGFKMAQVNCLAQGDLCNANGIKFYPQLVMYSDGKALDPYNGDRSYQDLTRWIDEQSTSYARGQLLAQDHHEQEVVMSGFARPNPEGKVLEVDEAALELMRGNGAVLVKYYAPWCGHCKKLAPIFDQVADALKNKMNVVAVNCDNHQAFCRRSGIKGYPTIKVLNRSSEQDYNGARTASQMQKFALKSVGPKSLQPIKLEDFQEIVESDPAFFLYLQNFDTSVSDLNMIKESLEPLLSSVPSYTSSDPLLYRHLSIANPPPTSVLLAFSGPSTEPAGSLPFPASNQDLEKFVSRHRFPTLTQLTAGNFQEVFKSEHQAIVVLGAVHRGDEGAKERAKLEEVARAWKKGGRDFSRPVWFVWVEGERWASWLSQAYEIKKSALPSVVVIDSPNSEYYDMTIEGTKIEFEGASIFSVLEGFYNHFLRPKKSETTFEWGSRSATMTLIKLAQTSVDHPFYAIISVITATGLFVFLASKCTGRTGKENGLREKGFSRMD